jgi:hypothetical protein
MDSLTIEEFKSALPSSLKRAVNQEVLDQINLKFTDPDMFEEYRNNLLGFVNVMSHGKFKMTGYIDAVKYVSHKLMNKTNLLAFSDTFPEKIAKWTAQGLEAKDINSYVSSYNGSKLIKLLYEQVVTPIWIVNQDVLQKAINVQADLMITARSEKVRSDAAAHLMTHLKPPEVAKIELNLGAKPDSSLEALRVSTAALVVAQQQALIAGQTTATQMAAAPLKVINEEYEER